MSSHSIHTQSNNALHTAPRASATIGLFDQAMVAAVVIAIAYIASIMVGGAVMQEDEPIARRFHPPDQHHLPAAT